MFVSDSTGHVGAVVLPCYGGEEGNIVVTSVLRCGGSKVGAALSVHNLRYDGFDVHAGVVRLTWVPEQSCIGKRGLLRAQVAEVRLQCRALADWAKSLLGRSSLEAATSNVEAVVAGRLGGVSRGSAAQANSPNAQALKENQKLMRGSIVAIGSPRWHGADSNCFALRIAQSNGDVVCVECGGTNHSVLESVPATPPGFSMPSALRQALRATLRQSSSSSAALVAAAVGMHPPAWKWSQAPEEVLQLRVEVIAEAKKDPTTKQGGRVAMRSGRVSLAASGMASSAVSIAPPAVSAASSAVSSVVPAAPPMRETRSSAKKRKAREEESQKRSYQSSSQDFSQDSVGDDEPGSASQNKSQKLRRSSRRKAKRTRPHGSLRAGTPKVSSPSASPSTSHQGGSQSDNQGSSQQNGTSSSLASLASSAAAGSFHLTTSSVHKLADREDTPLHDQAWLGSSLRVLPFGALCLVDAPQSRTLLLALPPLEGAGTPPLELTIQPRFLQHIRSGVKSWEGRLYNARYKTMRVGDKLKLVTSDANEDGGAASASMSMADTGAGDDAPTALIVIVEEVKFFATFRAMLTACGLQRCLPDVSSMNAGVQIYRAFPGYAAGVGERGVVAFRISVLGGNKNASRGAKEQCVVGMGKKRRNME